MKSKAAACDITLRLGRVIAAQDLTMIEALMEVGADLARFMEPHIPGSPAPDSDSQPLTQLGVSVMDQDALERSVAARVRNPDGLADSRLMLPYQKEMTSWTEGDLRNQKSGNRIFMVSHSLIAGLSKQKFRNRKTKSIPREY